MSPDPENILLGVPPVILGGAERRCRRPEGWRCVPGPAERDAGEAAPARSTPPAWRP